MDLRAVVLASTLATVSGVAHADEMGAYVHTRIGRAEAPFYAPGLPVARSEFTQALSFVVGGHLRISPEPRSLTLGVRVPMAPSLVAEPGGSYVDNKAFGNPELWIEHALPWRMIGNAVLDTKLRVAVGAPLAYFGPEGQLTRNRVVAISAAMEGWREPELFTPGVLPITVGAMTRAERGRFAVETSAEVPVLIRTGDADIGELGETRSIAIIPNASIRARFTPASLLSFSLAGHLAAELRSAVAHDQGRFAPSLEARLDVALGAGVGLSFDALTAVGGLLGNTLGIGVGVEVRR